MSPAYICVSCGFFSHRKTLRLVSMIGERAFFIPPRLWAYAAMNQRNGNFSDYTATDYELILGLPTGDGEQVSKALREVKFITDKGRIHDWKFWNKFFTTSPERFKKAARERYRQEDEAMRAAGLSRDEWFDLSRPERRRIVAEHKDKLAGKSPAPAPEAATAGKKSTRGELWEKKERVKAIENLLENHKGNPQHGRHEPIQAAEFRTLKRDREALLKQISGASPEKGKTP